MSPSSIRLPSTSTLVEDVDEEIFLLYTKKLQTSALTKPSKSLGLGFVQTNAEVLPISFTISGVDKMRSSSLLKGKKLKPKRGSEREIKFDMELWQDLDKLRNIKGDTGSVLWQISLYLGQFLLKQRHFSSTPLFPTLSKSKILELGSGTAFLGILIIPLLEKSTNWTFTDQLPSLPLVLKNLRKNWDFIDKCRSIQKREIVKKGGQKVGTLKPEEEEYSVRECDWLVDTPPITFTNSTTLDTQEEPPDLIFAIDCIYNPSISLPLVKTIAKNAGPNTVVLVASELRDEDALEVFLRGWLELEGGSWKIWRVGFEEGEELGGKDFVVWAGWRE